jgi:hypothetical protein
MSRERHGAQNTKQSAGERERHDVLPAIIAFLMMITGVALLLGFWPTALILGGFALFVWLAK